jgi:hypothetical protein
MSKNFFDCGLRKVDCGFNSAFRIPNSEIVATVAKAMVADGGE